MLMCAAIVLGFYFHYGIVIELSQLRESACVPYGPSDNTPCQAVKKSFISILTDPSVLIGVCVPSHIHLAWLSA